MAVFTAETSSRHLYQNNVAGMEEDYEWKPPTPEEEAKLEAKRKFVEMCAVRIVQNS